MANLPPDLLVCASLPMQPPSSASQTTTGLGEGAAAGGGLGLEDDGGLMGGADDDRGTTGHQGPPHDDAAELLELCSTNSVHTTYHSFVMSVMHDSPLPGSSKRCPAA